MADGGAPQSGTPSTAGVSRIAVAPGNVVAIANEWTVRAPQQVSIQIAVFMLSNIPDAIKAAALQLRDDHVSKAQELLAPHNLTLDVVKVRDDLLWIPAGQDASVQSRPVESEGWDPEQKMADCADIQKTADAAMPNVVNVEQSERLGERLQIVYAKIHDGEKLDVYGETFTQLPSGRMLVIVNIDKVAWDRVTLLHETIHAAGLHHRNPLPIPRLP